MRNSILTAATILLATGGVPALADMDMDPGAKVYNQYCATCHGASADGRGPLTELMTNAVPDLTGLSARNDGVFPMLEVIHVIDGRTGLRGHGGPMPIYGAIFDDEVEDSGPYGGPIYTRGKILSLAYYLESIQK
ncbi:cytochrome c [Thalassovita sp.]|uniref:c-type cytochrome n=1 Tax=Thalassovita sp. TaxID=1979401 RepID=UPI0029DE8734|nr:cytochrome c [Thalassovita sp.]